MTTGIILENYISSMLLIIKTILVLAYFKASNQCTAVEPKLICLVILKLPLFSIWPMPRQPTEIENGRLQDTPVFYLCWLPIRPQVWSHTPLICRRSPPTPNRPRHLCCTLSPLYLRPWSDYSWPRRSNGQECKSRSRFHSLCLGILWTLRGRHLKRNLCHKSKILLNHSRYSRLAVADMSNIQNQQVLNVSKVWNII